MNGYVKQALVTMLVLAVVFRVAPLKSAVTGA